MAALTSILLAGAAVASAGVGVYNAVQQADAGKQESDFNAEQANRNARLANTQADDAIARGDVEAKTLKSKIGQVVGTQRAGFASQGVDVNNGSAAQVQDDTRTLIERDATTIKNNAWREAWGYRMEAQNYTGTASMIKTAGENRYKNTLLTGGLSALDTGVRGFSAFRGSK